MADDFDESPDVDFRDFGSAVDAMIQHFRERAVLTEEEFYSLDETARRRAFTVSGVADLDIVADVWEAIDRAVTDGETLEDFRARVGEELEAAWGRADPAQLETIFRTNVHSAYSAGRAVENARVRDTHPYERYSVVDDARTSDICEELIGVVVPSGTGPVPPLHCNCRTDKVAITEDEARELGADVEDGDSLQADEGFGGDPLADWEPDVTTRPAELASIYELKLNQ